jgi:hypothetical protein
VHGADAFFCEPLKRLAGRWWLEEETMGGQYEARCLDCGRRSTVSIGGGFFFHLLHCDKCGASASVPLDDIGDAHRRWVKGLEGPWTVVTSEWDREVQNDPTVESMSDDEYHQVIEEVAGGCECGGIFRLQAPPRCQVCHSAALDMGQVQELYD